MLSSFSVEEDGTGSKHEKVLQEQVDYLTKKLFGSSSERRSDDIPGQQNLFDEAETEQDPSLLEEETVIREHTRKKKATHEDLFKGLKVEKVVIPLPEEEQICPVCGTQMVLIGEEYVRRELEFIPATCKVIEYYSQSYGCPSCKEGLGDTEKPVIIKSQVPSALVGKGPASASTVAWTMYQKYANGHCPGWSHHECQCRTAGHYFLPQPCYERRRLPDSSFHRSGLYQRDGELPVEATLIRIPEKKIIFDSRDMDVHGEFDTIEPLQATGDPYDPFALQKACLLACGVIPKEGGNLEEILTRMGGGFEMHSEVTNVPKGSGLGTSSILSAACVKAVFEFLGIQHTEADLYSHVLAMEQIMSTGGGWQDQVGGVTNGIKYITSRPGIRQQLTVEHVKISPETKEELNQRFCLIYTGQRRLARNLLRDVVGRYVGNEPDSLYVMNEIQKVASLMRFELMRGNVDAFAELLEYHWQLSKKMDAGSTNTLIDQIFAAIDHMIAGRLVCGAGGGGFLQVILKKGVTREMVHKRLKEVFQDNPVDVWECELI